jgi:hypothetical protein
MSAEQAEDFVIQAQAKSNAFGIKRDVALH